MLVLSFADRESDLSCVSTIIIIVVIIIAGLVQAKPRRQRETFWLVWTRGNLRIIKGCIYANPHGNPGRRPKDRAQRFGVIRRKTPGADPRTAPW